MVEPRLFHNTVSKLREFFNKKGLIECHLQDVLSILSVCEDPVTIGTFEYSGQVWPLKQTNQMELEKLLLFSDESIPGYYCLTTSYRQEANPIPGRHDLIFPMFEFEFWGDFNDLVATEGALLEHLGFDKDSFEIASYDALCEHLNVTELSYAEEEQMEHPTFIVDFPENTSPFWNMKRENFYAKKCDVIINGIETIGSAERETDAKIMLERFHTISDGKYADLLFAKFGRERVLQELNEFLLLNFKPRVGAGIGLTRLCKHIRSTQL